MSAESGVPTYRGRGGIWHEYKWEEYACEDAFVNDPDQVLDFHELRRIEALKCKPHHGHNLIKLVQERFPNTTIVTQNIDGMHQRADTINVIELHGSLWEMRCQSENRVISDSKNGKYANRYCDCGLNLRPNIIWFQDMLEEVTVQNAIQAITDCDLFVSIGTSAMVWPAAGFPNLAKNAGAYCIEINPEETELSSIYDRRIREKAGGGLDLLLKENLSF
ncbi:MAG: Sir2 family NAD-dependent protein deacetylase [Candidatus Marinimicrobia bacterium]|jgi:NAD-dependent deacetylase|nr:Sir2 family NAD-dependent protein deacetylase [Candidatus Neomarinimicrobiota bacterium]|tara:strand:+ start:2856 stop:3515 length:660 start_codon:yes stop_codon:yes gene_type:complete